MTLLQEIVEWSQDRPAWQRDALRRLLQNGELAAQDLSELTEICKAQHGLAEPQQVVPLTESHIPHFAKGMATVSLVSIFHHRGVNALAENQTLHLGPGLTLVYGDNAAGKTGYIRILKTACRARGHENILGNVVSGQLPFTPVVSIKYKIDGDAETKEWTGDNKDSSISHVSVFDAHSAAVYLNEKTDVAFRPFGLDLFDQLVQTCKAVRGSLEKERAGLSSHSFAALLTSLPQGTEVANVIANINSLTNPETIKSLTTFSDENIERLGRLERSLLDLQANDPAKLVRELELRRSRLRKLAEHTSNVETILSTEAFTAMFGARTQGREVSKESKRLREMAFSGVLPGTGSEIWKELWEAARRFANQEAYRNAKFPAVESCVLCQRTLDSETLDRLNQFEAFVASATESKLKRIREGFVQLRKKFLELKVRDASHEETINEIKLDNEDIAERIESALLESETRQSLILSALSEDTDVAADCLPPVSVTQNISALISELETRIRAVNDPGKRPNPSAINAEIAELRTRKLLAQHQQTALSEIERRKKDAAYALCLDETRTQAITQKSTILTKTAVSERLKKAFQDELAHLSFRHVEVELREVGGADGVMYHKLVLSRAPNIELPKVASEGEQRCLSVAAFFAELSTADSPSAIVFDDPVSSLDYKWREKIAERLVREANHRQVIVFTHDVVFLLQLRQKASESAIEPLDQHVRRVLGGAGVCSEELPWVALQTKKKIGFLKKKWQEAAKLFRDGHQDAYEKDAKFLYGLLRETWERALEEILLAGVVERFRHNVETRQIDDLADITPADCQTFTMAMTKSSKWLAGHDQGAAARAPVPEPAELKLDIDALEKWVSDVKGRRK